MVLRCESNKDLHVYNLGKLNTKTLKRLSSNYELFSIFLYFLFKSFVKVELSYAFTINLFTITKNCMEK